MQVVLVGGMPRSGTALTGALLNNAPEVEVINEIPDLHRFPAFVELAGQIRSWSVEVQSDPDEAWRGITDEITADRVLNLFRLFCRTVGPVVPAGRWHLPSNAPKDVMALKQPNSEQVLEDLEDLLDPRHPRLVYCVRDPSRIYASLLSVPWGASISPEEYVDRLDASTRAADALVERAPDRVFVFDIDRTTELVERYRIVSDLFAWLGVPVSVDVEQFIREWNPVHNSAGRFDASKVPDASERARLVRAFETRFQKAQPVRTRWDRLRGLAG